MASDAGTRFESATRDYLEGRGLPVVKPAQSGFVDLGDLHVDPFVLQCKAMASTADAVRDAINGAVRQAGHGRFPVGVVKRRGKSTGEAFAVMRLSDFADLALRVRRAA